MRADVELVATGAELLDGRVLNTHGQVLARHLAGLGIALTRETTVGDDRAVIAQAVREALQRVDLVIVTGGLGPTSDDVTREAVADLVGSRLVMHEPSRQAIVARYARQHRALNAVVERHALVLEGATVWVNPVGLAPGEDVEHRGQHIFLLPGPPHEFAALLTECAAPRLLQLAGRAPPRVRVCQVCGIGESDIVNRLAGDSFPGPGVEVAYCANIGRVEVRLSADESRAGDLERAAALLRLRLGEHIYAETFDLLEDVVGRLCQARGWKLAVAESCTGGLVCHRLTNVSGSSAYFLGGVMAYANEAKVRDLGVPPGLLEREGAVSADVARAMAEGVRARFGADLGVAVTGIAGPTGGTASKPVGLVHVAVADAAGVVAREFRFVGSRAIIKEWSAQMALDTARRRLQESI